MSKGDRTKKDRNKVGVDGPWLALPCEFLASRACAELSPLALKMLVMMLGQLRANGFGNGRLDSHPNTLKAAGWTSTASAHAALHELIDAGIVVRTRRGAKGRLALYAVTLYPIHCARDGLEVGAGSWTVKDWRSRPAAEVAPTAQDPAVWRRPREAKNRKPTPRRGNASAECRPATGTHLGQTVPCSPATGTHPGVAARNAFPPGDLPSRFPSACVGCSPSALATGIGQLLAARVAPGRQPGHRETRARLLAQHGQAMRDEAAGAAVAGTP